MSAGSAVKNVVLVHGGFVDGSGWRPPAQRAMSERAGSVVAEPVGSHPVYVSHLAAVAALIEQAAAAASVR